MQNRPNFFTDQSVLADDLNQTNIFAGDQLKKLILSFLGTPLGINGLAGSAYVHGGVVGSPADHALPTNLKITSISNDGAVLSPGMALDNSGNIVVQDGSFFFPSYHSHWSSAPNSTMYIYVQYAEDPTNNKTDDIGGLHPTRYIQDNYAWVTVGLSPNPSYILLASFTTDSAGNPRPGTLTDLRQYARLIVPASGVVLDPQKLIDNQLSLTGIATVEDHVMSLGTGTPSAVNIHGLTFTDLGGAGVLSELAAHVEKGHVNGIVVYNPTPGNENSWKGTRSGSNIIFTAPSGAVLLVDGNPITNAFPNLTSAQAYAVGAVDGTYYAVAYWDIASATGKAKWVLDTEFNASTDFFVTGSGSVMPVRTNHNRTEYYILGKAVTTGAGTNFTSCYDFRGFGITTPWDISVDDELIYSAPAASNLNDTLSTTLSKLRYQVGKSIDGNPAHWNVTTYPLVDGTHNADTLHKHKFDNLIDVVSRPLLNAAALGTLTNGPQSYADNLHTHSLGSTANKPFVPDLAWNLHLARNTRNKLNETLDLPAGSHPVKGIFCNKKAYIASDVNSCIYVRDAFSSLVADNSALPVLTGVTNYKKLFYDNSFLFAIGEVGGVTNLIKIDVKGSGSPQFAVIANLTDGASSGQTDDGLGAAGFLWVTTSADHLLHKLDYSTMVETATFDLGINNISCKLTFTGREIVAVNPNVSYPRTIIYDIVANTSVNNSFGTCNPVFDGTSIWVAGDNSGNTSITRLYTPTASIIEQNLALFASDVKDMLYYDGYYIWMATQFQNPAAVYRYDPITHETTQLSNLLLFVEPIVDMFSDGVYIWFLLNGLDVMHKILIQ